MLNISLIQYIHLNASMRAHSRQYFNKRYSISAALSDCVCGEGVAIIEHCTCNLITYIDLGSHRVIVNDSADLGFLVCPLHAHTVLSSSSRTAEFHLMSYSH